MNIYPNKDPKNDWDDFTFFSASAMRAIASFSFPELSILSANFLDTSQLGG